MVSEALTQVWKLLHHFVLKKKNLPRVKRVGQRCGHQKIWCNDTPYNLGKNLQVAMPPL